MFWLEENDELSMEYLYGAIEKDKKDGVIMIPNNFMILKCLIQSLWGKLLVQTFTTVLDWNS